ncbi:MAG: Fe(II)-2OG oxygenase family protein [Algiphilus sp.]
MQQIPSYYLEGALRVHLGELVERIFEECPGESEYRYISRLSDLNLTRVCEPVRIHAKDVPALHIDNLPIFDDVQKSKILALLLGEAIGKCVAYSDYNQSYITDIRPTTLSGEASSGTTLLPPHSDLAFADDDCRPRHLVLVAHKSEGEQVKTLLCPMREIDAQLNPDERAILRENVFEITSGMKLAWRHLRITRLAVLTDVGNQVHGRYDLAGLRPIAELSPDRKELAMRALRSLEEISLRVGEQFGVVIQKGQALLISNDFCLHGRAMLNPSRSERMLLRAYVVPPAIVQLHNNRMIALGH